VIPLPIADTAATSGRATADASGVLYTVHEPAAYAPVWEEQQRLHQARCVDTICDTVLILEHRPVYTLGRRTQAIHYGGSEELLRSRGVDVHRVNRGGSVTYHGPGQIILYPIVRVSQHANGPKHFVHLLEEVVIRLLAGWHVAGSRLDRKPGVWVDGFKIASIGLRIERGISLHGLAVNVAMDLSPFEAIHPCGFSDCGMTSLAAVAAASPSMEQVKQLLAGLFGEVFQVDWPIVSLRSLNNPV
jgi:lipoate-protein ligase B